MSEIEPLTHAETQKSPGRLFVLKKKAISSRLQDTELQAGTQTSCCPPVNRSLGYVFTANSSTVCAFGLKPFLNRRHQINGS